MHTFCSDFPGDILDALSRRRVVRHVGGTGSVLWYLSLEGSVVIVYLV